MGAEGNPALVPALAILLSITHPKCLLQGVIYVSISGNVPIWSPSVEKNVFQSEWSEAWALGGSERQFALHTSCIDIDFDMPPIVRNEQSANLKIKHELEVCEPT